MTSGELLEASRGVASRLHVVGADLVEIAPSALRTADVTALAADGIAREILTGIVLRRIAA